MTSPRIAFVSGESRWWRKQRLAAKYLKMRLEGVVYPDVFCLAFMLSDKLDFLQEGEKVPAGKYDLILSELQASESQLRYLESLVSAGDPAVAVIPGPPAILSRDLTDEKLRGVKRILGGARHVWAYSAELKTFCDGMIPQSANGGSVVIPWPYDLAATRGLGQTAQRASGRYKILVQVPMSLQGIAMNHPFLLKGVLLDLWSELPLDLRERITFHTFVYDPLDREKYHASHFADGLPFVLEGKRGYRSFVRLLAECDGVFNLTSGSILGRITFLAAALERPGIFSDNSVLNQRLFPNSCVAMFDTVRLRELMRALLSGLASGKIDERLMPAASAAVEVGDFERNCRTLRQIAGFD